MRLTILIMLGGLIFFELCLYRISKMLSKEIKRFEIERVLILKNIITVAYSGSLW